MKGNLVTVRIGSRHGVARIQRIERHDGEVFLLVHVVHGDWFRVHRNGFNQLWVRACEVRTIAD